MNSRHPCVDRAAGHLSRPHAAIIGSGFGGLAAAIRLSVRGYRVTVLEKLDRPGGRARVHHQDGFVFDAGPTIITAPFLLEELWSMCQRNFADDVTLVPMSPFYRIRFDSGECFDYGGDSAAVCREIARFEPADVAGYKRYMRASEEIFKVGFEQLGHVPFDRLADMVRIIPDMLRLRNYRSVYSMVASYVTDPRVRMALSFHPLLIGGNPFTASSIYSLISFLEQQWGVHSAMGGTGRIIQGLADLVRGRGDEIRLNTGVEEIVVENGTARGVRLQSGEILAADIVVSNADAAWTYRHLLPATTRRHWSNTRLEKSRYSNGLFVWYFGTRRRYDDVPHHSILLGPRYRELLDDIFKHQRLASDFSLYLHRPTATDPSMAPEGCDTFYVLSPVPNLAAGIDWQQAAEPYRQAIEQRLSDTVLPGLKQQIVTSKVTTPQDFEHDLLAFRGAGFSFEPVLTQSAWFRPHNRSEDVAGLYIVGAGTHPGAGVPGVLSSARVLDSVVPHANIHA